MCVDWIVVAKQRWLQSRSTLPNSAATISRSWVESDTAEWVILARLADSRNGSGSMSLPLCQEFRGSPGSHVPCVVCAQWIARVRAMEEHFNGQWLFVQYSVRIIGETRRAKMARLYISQASP